MTLARIAPAERILTVRRPDRILLFVIHDHAIDRLVVVILHRAHVQLQIGSNPRKRRHDSEEAGRCHDKTVEQTTSPNEQSAERHEQAHDSDGGGAFHGFTKTKPWRASIGCGMLMRDRKRYE
jgi:hypothetical protein